MITKRMPTIKEEVVVALVRATAANRDLCHVLWPLYAVLLCA